VLKAQEANPAAAADLKGNVLQAQGLAAKGKHAEAHVALDGVEDLLNKSAVKEKPRAKESAPAADKAKFMARLKAMMPDITKAAGQATPTGQKIKARNAELQTLVGKPDLAAAGRVLDDIAKLLADDGSAEFTARLKALMPDIQKAKAVKTSAGQEVNLRVSE